jgi:hypothetical protein
MCKWEPETVESVERDRGLSEVLSYSLIFALIVASIGIVTVGGMNSLQNAQTSEQLSNAQRAFDVLHDNMADIYSEGAPSRGTEIALGDAELYFDENITMTVSLNGGGTTIEREIRPLVFRVSNERQLVYEAGATIRHERESGIVLDGPPIGLRASGNGDAYIPIVKTTAPTVQSLGGTTVLVRAESSNREILHADLQGNTDLSAIEIESPRYEAWLDYFEGREYCDSVSEPNPETARCDVGNGYDTPRHLYVTEQAIEISLIQ